MTGALSQMAAREHTLDLLCEAERQRSADSRLAERPCARRWLDALFTRWRREGYRL